MQTIQRAIIGAAAGRAGLRRRRGLTLIEASLMIVVVSIVCVAVAAGLQSVSAAPEINDRAQAISSELNSELENWRAVAFGASPWPSTLPYTSTDTVTLSIGGQQLKYARTTSIQKWDPNNLATNASPQTDFVQVKVTINSQSLAAYITGLN